MFHRIAAVVIMVSTIAWLLVSLLAEASVQKAVSRDAVDKALHCGRYMSSHISGLEDLIATGKPTDQQKHHIRQLRQLGDVFRFKLFDAKGRLVLISDESFIANPQGVDSAFDPEALEVVGTRVSIVDVFDGTNKPDRPDLYAEAYIPLTDRDGRISGVVEVYVDQTTTQAYFAESFKSFGLIISALSALLFLVPAAAFGVQRQRAERSRSEADYLAKFDVLTGLLNRSEFTRRSEAMIARGEMTALLFLDADKFKAINDTHGHAAGDSYLEHIGRTLASGTDPDDLVCRFGGDEFVIALSNATHDQVTRRVRTLLALCAKPLEVDGRSLTCSVSIGVSFLEAGIGLEQATAQADAALYHAKSAGRNQYALYGEDMGEEIRRRNRLEARIREATEKNEFTLQFQPLVAATGHGVIGFEALMRLELADGTPIPPSDFIPLAEEIGVIDKIGEWALFEAMHTVAQLPGTPKVAINLSASQFRSGQLPKLVNAALSAVDFAPERLELEITETLLLDDGTNVAFQIDALHEMGVCIAMDDFGTGFSSLGYLWKFGFDRIKIDQSFVAGLNDNPERSLEIIESVILLGKRLGMQVTAEGVETKEQSELLSRLGCDVLQGYFFGRPAMIDSDQRAGTIDPSERAQAGSASR